MSSRTSLDGNVLPLPPKPYLEKYWLICESVLVILTLGAVYLVVCLLKHALVKEITRKREQLCQKIWLKWLCVFSSVTLLLRLCSNHVAAFYGWQNDESCLITVTVSTVLFMVSLYSIYIFLWVRQSVFYADTIMKKMFPAWITYVSRCTLAFMIVTGAALSVMYNLPQVTQWSYTATSEGCKETSVDSPEIIPGIGAACSILFQVTLLALFIYPLLSREMAKFRTPKQSTSAVNEKYQNSSFSHSVENKLPKDDNDNVFYDDSPAESAATRSPTATPMSPLARNLERKKLKTPHVSVETDTGAESGADMLKTDADTIRTKNTTSKREMPPSPYARVERPQKRKSMVERLRSVHPGSIFYRRPKSSSLSSENTASPAVSDSEGRLRPRGSAFMKTLRSNEKKVRKLVAMMKRYALLMLVCVLTDIVAAAIQIGFVLPELVYLVIYDITLTINLVCVVMTFTEWRLILRPYLANETKANRITRTNKTTPARRLRKRDRVQELRQDGRRSRPGSRSALSSGSGYESGDSGHSHIHRQPNEANALIKSKR